MWRKKNAYRLLAGKPERKRQLGRPRRKLVDTINIDFGEIGWGLLIGLIWVRIGTRRGLV
jgi:hypothetical protein